ncbi:BTB/POZ domain-containing protein 9-like [Adelges cooleyi]|uniref:BTB/POZ domain-containing protein 9-like n=1 Tax=Adelges cooleyi TaxID=133065 RepID=UPI00217F705D|nr:BTB/POZ domain-containing protein 9-like [Adelges cooleyi]
MLIYFVAFIILWSTPGNSGYGTPPMPPSNHSNELIDHTEFLIEYIRNLYLSNTCSDVVLVVGKERLPAHRIILASRSEYFRRVFFEDDEESHKSEVNLNAAPVKSFEILHKYIYTGRINLSDLKSGEVFELLKTSDYFDILNLNLPLHEYLKNHRNEHIDHTDVLVEFIRNLHLSDICSDVVLFVGEERLPAHRIILASHSEYFRRVFFEDDKKSHKSEVNLSDAPVTSFEMLLKYIYTGRINLGDLKSEEVFEFLRISDYFGISNLKLPLHEYLKNHRNEHIDHTDVLVEFIRNLHLSDICSDVVLVVGEERLPAHRIILASHSEYFMRFFSGDYEEARKSEVNLSDASITSYKLLFTYIYTGQINLGDLEGEEVFELLRISDYYGILKLKLPLHDYLKSTIDVENAWSFFAMTRTYKYNDLEVESLHFIDNHASQLLQSEDFLTLSPEVLQDIIIRDTFYCNELDIFHAVCRWIKKHQNILDHDTKMKVLSAIRYPLMSIKELTKVRQSPLVKSNTSLHDTIFRNTSSPDKLQYRGQLQPNVNLIHRPCQYELIREPSNTPVINGINGSSTITLRVPSFINYIEISLSDGGSMDESRYYSYYIEVSMDQNVWFHVIDHSNYNCRSIQKLWIKPRIVRYIHIVGTRSTAKATFGFSKVKYNTEEMHEVEIKNGLVVPKYGYNVASSYMYAFVIKGEHHLMSQSMLNILYDDDYDRFGDKIDRFNMYTYHYLQSGCIVIHLAHPYILSSMRFLLWGGNDQFYKYTVEDSIDNQDWKWIAHESKELKQSWQVLKFTPRPILYIRITGVYNSAGNDFRCVYFEAPARVIVDDRGKNNETDVIMTEASTSNPVV